MKKKFSFGFLHIQRPQDAFIFHLIVYSIALVIFYLLIEDIPRAVLFFYDVIQLETLMWPTVAKSCSCGLDA